jgi:hypothetical protein
MTGDPVTYRLLQAIAILLFSIVLALLGGGAIALIIAFIGLVVAAVAPSTRPRG